MNDSTDLSAIEHFELALVRAREMGEPTHAKWRNVQARFDRLRGCVDPVMNENANLDILLRAVEAHQYLNMLSGADFKQGDLLRMQIQLSRLWLFSAYEGFRALHRACPKTCNSINGKGVCGEYACVYCHIGHLKNDLAVIRIPMAKGQIADSVKSGVLPAEAMENLLAMPEFQSSNVPPSPFLLLNEGIVTDNGTIHWAGMDRRLGKIRSFSRRQYSDMIVSFFSYPHATHKAFNFDDL